MKTPLLSVVMCTCNAENYITKAIESILTQSFRNFEFIIWDDGSTDDTKTIVDSFNDERIRYFYHENTGLGMALRLACNEARGIFIARMDSDDICLPDRLALEVDFLEKHPDFVLVSSAVNYIDKSGKSLGRSFPCSNNKVLKKVLCFGNMIIHPMVMMRRDAYQAAGGYIPIRYMEDILFWSRLAKQGKFYNICTPLGKYRLLFSSLDHSDNPYKGILRAFLLKMINDEEILESDVDEYNKLFLYSKNFIPNKKNDKIILYKKSLEERAYSVFRVFVGNRLAEKAIVCFKNLYYSLKLHV